MTPTHRIVIGSLLVASAAFFYGAQPASADGGLLGGLSITLEAVTEPVTGALPIDLGSSDAQQQSSTTESMPPDAPVESLLAMTTELVEPVTDAVAPVTEALAPVIEPVSRVTIPVLDVATEAVTVVSPVLEPVVTATDDVVNEIVPAGLVEALTPTLEQVTGPVVNALAPVIESPLLEPVAPILDAVAPGIPPGGNEAIPLATAARAIPSAEPDDVIASSSARLPQPSTSTLPVPPLGALARPGVPDSLLPVIPGSEATVAAGVGRSDLVPTDDPRGPRGSRVVERIFVPAIAALTAAAGGAMSLGTSISSGAPVGALLATSLLALALYRRRRVCRDVHRLISRSYAPLVPPG